jgi:hypothetical protein
MNIATWLCTAERSFYRAHAGGSTAPDGLHPVSSFGCSRSVLPLVVGSVGLNRWLFLDPHIQRRTGIVEFARVLRVGKLEHHLGVCVLAELWLHLPPPHGEGARRRVWLARDVKIDNSGARLFVERCLPVIAHARWGVAVRSLPIQDTTRAQGRMRKGLPPYMGEKRSKRERLTCSRNRGGG